MSEQSCERCGDFAPLTERRSSMLCASCVARLREHAGPPTAWSLMRETIRVCFRTWWLAPLLALLVVAERTVALVFFYEYVWNTSPEHWWRRVLPQHVLAIVQRALALGLSTVVLLEGKTLVDAWRVTRKRWLHLIVLGSVVEGPVLLADAWRVALIFFARSVEPGVVVLVSVPLSLLSWWLSVRLLLAPVLLLRGQHSLRRAMLVHRG